MLTVAEKIDIGKTSAYLVGEELDNGDIHSDILNEKQRILLRIVTDTIETQYNIDPSDSTLEKTSNYLLRLCKFKDKAQEDIASGGSGSIPTTPPSTLNQLNFTVAASGTTLIDGQSSTTISEFIGFNIVVVKNGTGLTQNITAPVRYTWVKSTGLLTVVPAAFLGDEFQITAV